MYLARCADYPFAALVSLSPGLQRLAAYADGQYYRAAGPGLPASPLPATTRELTRDLAGWSLPGGKGSAGKSGGSSSEFTRSGSRA
ncbi:hypothetical protein [Hymenobacter psoromatis]|uniref:hypothetical protein n=1 Tax=Hymenobacter psoromatis TaxID=1484116 RepID=UPI001CBD6D1A|nr:hypothetical protein [Hymenobacter psoromatis]